MKRNVIVGWMYSEPLKEEEIYKRTILAVRRKLAKMKCNNIERIIELARVTAKRYVG